MRRFLKYGTVCAVSLTAALALAQAPTSPSPRYTPDDEVVLKGKVAEVKVIPDWMGPDGVNIMLQAPDGTVVHVDTATAQFLKLLDFSVEAGDDLDITGCWVHVKGDNVFLARRIQKSRVGICIRDPKGKPVW